MEKLLSLKKKKKKEERKMYILKSLIASSCNCRNLSFGWKPRTTSLIKNSYKNAFIKSTRISKHTLEAWKRLRSKVLTKPGEWRAAPW